MVSAGRREVGDACSYAAGDMTQQMKVLFITQFSAIGGTSRLHALQFVPHLERDYGIEMRVISIYSDSFFRIQMKIVAVGRVRKFLNLLGGLVAGLGKKIYIVFLAGHYDVVFIQRETFPASICGLLLLRNPRVVYQLEDAIYEISQFLGKGFFPNIMLRYQAHLCRMMMRRAAWVIAENEGIAEEARKHNPRLTVISAPIDSDRFIPASEPRTDGRHVTIGWMGSPATVHILKTMDGVWRALGAKYGSRIQLKVVGAGREYAPPGIAFVSKDWRFDEEVGVLQSFDIGVAPHRDSPFERGRLGGKMIFYIMVGIPFVAGAGSLNQAIVQDGVAGFFADSDEEWIEKLSLLIENPELRARMGKTGRQFAEERFSLRSKIPIFAEVLKNTASL